MPQLADLHDYQPPKDGDIRETNVVRFLRGKRWGSEDLAALVGHGMKGALPAIEYFWMRELSMSRFVTPEERAEMEVRMLTKISVIKDATVRKHWRMDIKNRLYRFFGFDYRKPLVATAKRVPASNASALLAALERLERKARMDEDMRNEGCYSGLEDSALQ